MKAFALFSAFIALSTGSLALSADNGMDPVTKLPLPSTGAPLVLYSDPTKLDDVPVCKSNSTMNMYSVRSGTVKVALAWYASHLAGFKHVHGTGSGRSQDTYYNATGTLIVSITGEPGTEGQDVKVYSIIYGVIKPGVSDDVIAGMNVQKVVCPK